jgi:spore maturation protein CgeB
MKRLSIVILGLSIRSYWGNGHATTYRGLVRALAARGHRVLFLERNTSWYASAADMPNPDGARLEIYNSLQELTSRFTRAVRQADLIIVGSYIPQGIAVGHWVLRQATGVTAFYDIDTPVTMNGLMAGGIDYISLELLRSYDLYLSFTGGPLLTRLEAMGARRAYPLYCSADVFCHYPERPSREWDLGYMGTYSQDRAAAMAELLLKPAQLMPKARVIVAGAQYPEEISWPANVERVEHLAPQQHRSFFARQKFTLNLTREPMKRAGYSPSIRLFEAAACGCAIISDRWPGLENFFTPGKEILVARGYHQVMEYLDEISDTERDTIAVRARARVLAEHTAEQRVRQLEAFLAELDHSADAQSPARAAANS